MTRASRPRLAALALLTAPALLLVACSGGAEEAGSTSAASSSSAAASSSAAPSPSEASPSGGTETILAVLCDEAAPESVAAIEAALKPDFTVSQLVDVRTDDEAMHAILGYVEGPGYAVLAQWTGTGLGLEGLASADDLAAEVSTAPRATPDADTEDLLGQTVTCYSTLFAPEDGDDKKKDDKNAE